MKSAASSVLTVDKSDDCGAELRETKNASSFCSRLSVLTRCCAETRPTPPAANHNHKQHKLKTANSAANENQENIMLTFSCI